MFPTFAEGGLLPTLTTLTRIMLLQPILLGFSNLFASIAQARHRFISYALSPIFYNAGIIIGVVFLYPKMGLKGLSLGVVIGAALHLLCQLSTITKPFPSFSFPFDFRTIREVVGLSFSRTLALSGSQLSTLVLIIMAAIFCS